MMTDLLGACAGSSAEAQMQSLSRHVSHRMNNRPRMVKGTHDEPRHGNVETFMSRSDRWAAILYADSC